MSILNLIKNDKDRMQVLSYVAELRLPDCWVAAGFVRNMVWDYLHRIPSTDLNDIDVIFFDCSDVENHMGNYAQKILNDCDPTKNWEVKISASHESWINASLNKVIGSREDKWTQSIAVGSKPFIEDTKRLLGLNGRGRTVRERDGSFELREPSVANWLALESR